MAGVILAAEAARAQPDPDIAPPRWLQSKRATRDAKRHGARKGGVLLSAPSAAEWRGEHDVASGFLFAA